MIRLLRTILIWPQYRIEICNAKISQGNAMATCKVTIHEKKMSENSGTMAFGFGFT